VRHFLSIVADIFLYRRDGEALPFRVIPVSYSLAGYLLKPLR